MDEAKIKVIVDKATEIKNDFKASLEGFRHDTGKPIHIDDAFIGFVCFKLAEISVILEELENERGKRD